MAKSTWKNEVSFDIHHYEWQDTHCSRVSDWEIKIKQKKPKISLAIACADWECSKSEICGVDCKYLIDKGPLCYSRTECKNYDAPYSNWVIDCKYAPHNWKD